MVGILDLEPGPSSPRLGIVSSPRLFSRRMITVLLLLGAFMTVLMLTPRQIGQICGSGSYCYISGLRGKSSKFGNDGADTNASETTTKGSSGQNSESGTSNDECTLFPKAPNALLVMKTGASESFSKIPMQLMTTLKCLDDFLLFSDMSQKIAGYTIHDSLDTVLEQVKGKNKDFDIYHRQKQCPIDQEQCNKKHDVAKQGWDLDKYKNIHMAEKTYSMRPNYDWYLFVDADTYVVFANLVKWLAELDPKKPQYIGSVAYLDGIPFGHGGSGYLMSKSAMRSMFEGKTGVANRYDEPVQHTCCGDYMLSKALKDEIGIEPFNAWPIINGEKPHTLSYAEDEWCQPLVTMHHAAAEDISDLYAFERERQFAHPLRIRDLYHKFVAPHLVEERADWDNLSEDVYYLNSSATKYEEWEINRAKKDGMSDEERDAHNSFVDCKTACLSLDNCFQFRYENGICGIAHKFKHGKPVKRGDDDRKRFMSGWNVKKIKQWIEKNDNCDQPLKWPIKDSK